MDCKEISLGEALEARIKALAAEVWDSTAEVYELNEANETHAKTCAALEVAVRNLTEALAKTEALAELRRVALEEYYAFLKGYVAHINNDQITAACIELLELGSAALAATPSAALAPGDLVGIIRRLDPEHLCDFIDEHGAEEYLRKWLEAVKREAKVEALREMASQMRQAVPDAVNQLDEHGFGKFEGRCYAIDQIEAEADLIARVKYDEADEGLRWRRELAKVRKKKERMIIKPIDTLDFLRAMDRESESRDNPYAAALKLITNLGSDFFDANMRAVNNAVRLEVLIGIVRAVVETLDSCDHTPQSAAAAAHLRNALTIAQHEKEEEEQCQS